MWICLHKIKEYSAAKYIAAQVLNWPINWTGPALHFSWFHLGRPWPQFIQAALNLPAAITLQRLMIFKASVTVRRTNITQLYLSNLTVTCGQMPMACASINPTDYLFTTLNEALCLELYLALTTLERMYYVSISSGIIAVHCRKCASLILGVWYHKGVYHPNKMLQCAEHILLLVC